jgi:large subunit ribosomal protein L21
MLFKNGQRKPPKVWGLSKGYVPPGLLRREKLKGTDMFAVVKTGGKQYRVTEGDVIKVEKLEGDVGKNITLDEVLMIGDEKGVKVGEPLLKGASVTADVLEQKKDKKITVFKKKRRQNYRRKKGHRQEITVLRVKSIAATAAKKKAPAKKAEPKTKEAAAE